MKKIVSNVRTKRSIKKESFSLEDRVNEIRKFVPPRGQSNILAETNRKTQNPSALLTHSTAYMSPPNNKKIELNELIQIEADTLLNWAAKNQSDYRKKTKKRALVPLLSGAARPISDASILSLDSGFADAYFSSDFNWLDTLFASTQSPNKIDSCLLKKMGAAYQQPLPCPLPLKTYLMPLYATKDEAKKFRRIKKVQRINKRNERVRLGLAPIPPQKVKMATLPNILISNPHLNPTEIDLNARKAYEERQKRHEDHNRARKLTPTGKRAKLLRKLRRDSSRKIILTLLWVKRVSRATSIRKCLYFLKKHFFNGLLILPRESLKCILPSLFFIEGGQHATRKLYNLVNNRIKWSTKIANAENVHLLWRGEIGERYFSDLKIIKVLTLEKINAVFEKYELGTYRKLFLNNIRC